MSVLSGFILSFNYVKLLLYDYLEKVDKGQKEFTKINNIPQRMFTSIEVNRMQKKPRVPMRRAVRGTPGITKLRIKDKTSESWEIA